MRTKQEIRDQIINTLRSKSVEIVDAVLDPIVDMVHRDELQYETLINLMTPKTASFCDDCTCGKKEGCGS